VQAGPEPVGLRLARPFQLDIDIFAAVNIRVTTASSG